MSESVLGKRRCMEEPAQTVDYTALLPSDVLAEALSYIRVWPLLRAVSLVCKRWRTVALRAVRVYRHKPLKYIDYALSSLSALRRFVSLTPDLRELHLYGVNDLALVPLELRRLSMGGLFLSRIIGQAAHCSTVLSQTLTRLEALTIDTRHSAQDIYDVAAFAARHASKLSEFSFKGSAELFVMHFGGIAFDDTRLKLFKLHLHLEDTAFTRAVAIAKSCNDALRLVNSMPNHSGKIKRVVKLRCGTYVPTIDPTLLSNVVFIGADRLTTVLDQIKSLQSIAPHIRSGFSGEKQCIFNSNTELGALEGVTHLIYRAAVPFGYARFVKANDAGRLARLRAISVRFLEKFQPRQDEYRAAIYIAIESVRECTTRLETLVLDLTFANGSGNDAYVFMTLPKLFAACVDCGVRRIYICARLLARHTIIDMLPPRERTAVVYGWIHLIVSSGLPKL